MSEPSFNWQVGDFSSLTDTGAWDTVNWSPELGVFIATAHAANHRAVAWSEDGIVWFDGSIPTEPRIASGAWSPALERFAFATMDTSSAFAYSDDGKTVFDANDNAQGTSIIWSPGLGLFLAGIGSDHSMAWSADGLNWSFGTQTFDGSPMSNAMAWSPQLGIATCIQGMWPNNPAVGRWTDNGQIWNEFSTSDEAHIRAIEWSPKLGMFVAIGGEPAFNRVYTFLTSTNGTAWNAHQTPVQSEFRALEWVEGGLDIFVTLTYAEGPDASDVFVMWSADGVNWESESLGIPRFDNQSTPQWIDAAWSPELNRMVAVASNGGPSQFIWTPLGIDNPPASFWRDRQNTIEVIR